MAVTVTISFEHATPRAERAPTIWEALAEKLGREPTRQEAIDDVRRIMDESTVRQASAGRLPHQRRR